MAKFRMKEREALPGNFFRERFRSLPIPLPAGAAGGFSV